MENEWFEQLTEAQRTKLRGMGGSMEELAAFCKEENLDLPDDVLDAVSGGGKDIFCTMESGPSVGGCVLCL